MGKHLFNRRRAANVLSSALSRSINKRRLQPIALPQHPSRLKAEVRDIPPEQALITSGEFEVFYAAAGQIPSQLREIGRLREIAFRAAGEGTGRAIDLDGFDAHYIHLFLWNEESREVVGAYRIGRTDEILRRHGLDGFYTRTLFDYRHDFIDEIGPALEMGRSFVRPEYQKSIMPLFLLWKGIGRYVLNHPQYRRLFGPVSISNDYTPVSRQLMVDFLRTHYYDSNLSRLVKARMPMAEQSVEGSYGQVLLSGSVDEASALISDIEGSHRGLPVLLKQYLKLGGMLLGFNLDKDFCDTMDGLIMIDLTLTDRRMLERYMGEEGAAMFLAHHSNCVGKQVLTQPAGCARL